MRWVRQAHPPAHRTRRRLIVAAGLVSVLCVTGPAALADEPLDLERAEERREAAEDQRVQLQRELDVLLSRIEALKVAQEQQSAQVERLEADVESQRQRADAARARVADHYRKAYASGTSGDPLVSIFSGTDLEDVTERARLLSVLADGSAREREAAEGASARSEAMAEQLAQASALLAEQTGELTAHQDEAQRKVAAAQEQVEEIDEEISAEKRRRAEAARRRAAREAQRAAEASERAADASSGGSGGGGGNGGGDSGAGAVSGGIACPVGDPVSFSDTYGAPRSGGRSHMGVDMLSPIGTPIYAYEDGVISRMNNSSLGGISLYLTGASGNEYYYTHLSGYASGISAGQRVTAGQHIAHNGDSGNAAGIPHLHFEVRPGGGGNVNPYPYAKRACG